MYKKRVGIIAISVLLINNMVGVINNLNINIGENLTHDDVDDILKIIR